MRTPAGAPVPALACISQDGRVEMIYERYSQYGDIGDGTRFADPGGRSALRAASRRNPRNLPCPTCGEPDRLTAADRARGYQCDACADRAEGGGW